VRPILDYLFLEAADNPLPESEMAPETWYVVCFLSLVKVGTAGLAEAQ
jgi:hypothetical protein